MKIGYARVSTIDQNLDLQIDSLKKAGCQKIITDKISGSLQNRTGLEELLNTIRKDDEENCTHLLDHYLFKSNRLFSLNSV